MAGVMADALDRGVVSLVDVHAFLEDVLVKVVSIEDQV